MSKTIYIDPKDEKLLTQIGRVAFPSYNGRKQKVCITEDVQINHTYWDEGNRYEYVAVSLDGQYKVRRLPEFNPPQFGGPTENPIVNLVKQPIPTCIVELYCSGRSGYYLTYYLAPQNASKLIENKEESLSKNERIVLCATRSLKSSYSGISNFRFHEANRQTGISLNEWEDTVQFLIQKRLLRKNKSITPAGKNAIGNVQLWELKSYE